ncbi:MAG: PilZ domain-containing protein, partial [bacterium]|nr:PilZ domain-containing protein [bacterium]
YASVEPAVVTLITDGNCVEAETVDVSKSGLRIRLIDPLVVGSRLRVRFGTVIAFGEVRWCRQVHGGNYDAGIQVGHTLAEALMSSIQAAVVRVKEQVPEE